MKVRTLVEMGATCCSHPHALVGRKKYLFLLSHMRSFSSVFAHVLGSHPEVSGHTERLRRYHNRLDLLKVRVLDARAGGDTGCEYYLDKVLHNQYAISDQVMKMPNVKMIIFMREPAATLQSIFRLGRDILHDDTYCDPTRNLRYYTQRLETLVRYAQQSRDPLYFDAEQIVEAPEVLLRFVGEWLGLRTPLSSRYELFPDSQVSMRGDPSKNLRAGNILPPRSKQRDEVEIQASLLAEAQMQYKRCRQALLDQCHTLPTCSANASDH